MRKIVEYYDKAEAHILAISLAVTTLLIFIQVILRYVFNSSLHWSEELARYVFIWQIWLGTSIAMKTDEHIRMDMLGNKLNERGKMILSIISNSLMLLFCLFLVCYGSELVHSMMRRGISSPALRIPMWVVYLALPASQLIVGMRLISRIIKNTYSLLNGRHREKGVKT